ncbi:hypothetical protein [Streptomyces syringium]|uniref:hypothetical protein n=1 Tax=Streptomyces syringium TaxID=76729 RepID=UPI003AAEA86C
MRPITDHGRELDIIITTLSEVVVAYLGAVVGAIGIVAFAGSPGSVMRDPPDHQPLAVLSEVIEDELVSVAVKADIAQRPNKPRNTGLGGIHQRWNTSDWCFFRLGWRNDTQRTRQDGTSYQWRIDAKVHMQLPLISKISANPRMTPSLSAVAMRENLECVHRKVNDGGAEIA